MVSPKDITAGSPTVIPLFITDQLDSELLVPWTMDEILSGRTVSTDPWGEYGGAITVEARRLGWTLEPVEFSEDGTEVLSVRFILPVPVARLLRDSLQSSTEAANTLAQHESEASLTVTP